MIRSIRLEKVFRNTGIVIQDIAKELNAKAQGVDQLLRSI